MSTTSLCNENYVVASKRNSTYSARMNKVDPRIELIGEVVNALFRQHKVTRAEVERRMGRAKGYLYRGFHGLQGLSLENLLHALDAAEVPFEKFCERLYRETHQQGGGGLAILPAMNVREVVAEALAQVGHESPEASKPAPPTARSPKAKKKR